MSPGMKPPESVERVLMLFLASRRDAAAAEKLKELVANDFPWADFIMLANQERVTPLVYKQALQFGLLPVPYAEQMRAIYLANLAENMRKLRDLEEILSILNQAGIAAIVLKGGALGEIVYHNPGLRPMSDLDVLVRKGDLQAALRCLQESGWVNTTLESHQGSVFDDAHHAHIEKAEKKSTLLELHWVLFGSSHYQNAILGESIWETAQPACFGKANGFLLPPEAQVLHLCSHLCLHHAGQGLLWLNDVAEVLDFYKGQIDWRHLVNLAVENELVYALQLVLPRVVSDLGGTLPKDVLEEVMSKKRSQKEEDLFPRLMDLKRPAFVWIFDHMGGLKNWKSKLSYVARQTFPSFHYIQVRYHVPHPFLTPFYYPYRWYIGLKRRN